VAESEAWSSALREWISFLSFLRSAEAGCCCCCCCCCCFCWGGSAAELGTDGEGPWEALFVGVVGLEGCFTVGLIEGTGRGTAAVVAVGGLIVGVGSKETTLLSDVMDDEEETLSIVG
jgi:hypothetical protein